MLGLGVGGKEGSCNVLGWELVGEQGEGSGHVLCWFGKVDRGWKRGGEWVVDLWGMAVW